jgi:hypothetical protein
MAVKACVPEWHLPIDARGMPSVAPLARTLPSVMRGGLHTGTTAARSNRRMTPRYIAARRPDGTPSRHLTTRQLGRIRARFQRLLLLMATSLLLAACVVR